MPIRVPKIIDISLALDASTFKMRTYAGFKKDMQFEIEVIKDYPGGLGQIVRGAHMRLHAGTHVDAPVHFINGAAGVDTLSLDVLVGPALVIYLPDVTVVTAGGTSATNANDQFTYTGGTPAPTGAGSSWIITTVYRVALSALIGICRSLSNSRSASAGRPSVVR